MNRVFCLVHSSAPTSGKRRFNVRFLSAKPLQSLADIIPQNKSGNSGIFDVFNVKIITKALFR